MTRMKTSIYYPGRFSRINDTVSVKKVDPFFRQFYNRYWEKAKKKNRLIETLIKRFLKIK